VAQDAAEQKSILADAARATGVLGHGLATVVDAVVRLDGELARTLGDVGHLGAVRHVAHLRTLHKLTSLGLVNAEPVGNVASRNHLLSV